MNCQCVTALIIKLGKPLVGNEYVNAHRILRLSAVCGKPTQIVGLINHVQVVIGGRIEWHSNILWFEKLAGLAVVT